MGKTLGYGEITVANMTEPFTVMLTNEAQQFATDSNRKVTSAQSYYTDIIVIRGSQERTDYTIGNITSGSGITVSNSSKRVTFSVSAGSVIGADTGVIEIPITLDGQTVKKQFSWSCGKQGPQGVKGQDGTSVKITSKSVTYQTSTSGTTAPTGTWLTTVPTVNNGQYLWTKTTVQYSDGNKTEAYSVSYKGTNGTNGTSVTVSKTEVTYQVSTSGTTAPTGAWSATMPTCDQGQYLWTKTYVKYSDGKETTSYSVSYKGVDGEKFAFNMLRETNQGSKHWVNMGASGKYSVESITTEDSINAVKLICTEPIASNEWQFCDFSDYEMLKSLKASTTYTLSYDIKTNRSGKILHNIKTGGGQKVFFANDIACKVLGNETWEHVSLKMTSGTTLPNLDGQVIYMFGDALSKVGYSIIKNLKLTEGIIDTPWAPHPKDLEGRGVSETVQYYLATSQASGVTSSTSGWSTDITTQKLTVDKKYLWNCYQTKYSDGTSEPISTPKVIGVYGDKGTSTKIIRTGYKYTQNNIDTFSASGYSRTWGTADATTGLKVGDNVLLRVKNTTKGSDCLIFASITAIPSNYSLTCTSYGLIDNGADGQDGEDGVGFHWNLLKYSGDLSKQVLGGAGTYTATVESIEDKTTPSGQAEKITYTVQGTGGKFIQTGKYIKEGDIKQGKTYTVSVWCKCSSIKSTGVINAEFLDNKTYVNPTLSTEWQQYVVTGVANKDVTSTSSASAISFYYSDNMSVGDIFYISSPKVEEGDKASPWCTTYEETLAKNLTITPSSQYFKSTDGGKTFAPNTITIKPTIQGEISFGKWQYSIDGGVSFADAVSGQKGLTVSNNVLTVSKDSSLYSDAVTMITFRAVADDSSFYDTCSIAKIYDVSDIGDGRNLWITRDNITLQACEKDKYIYTTTGTSGVCIGADATSVGTNTIALQTGTKYTISFVISSPSEVGNALWYFCTALNSTGVKNYGGYSVKLVTGENIVSQTITVDTSCDAAGLVIYNLPTDCIIKDIQVEKGSSPTGWTPAPEDFQMAILSTKSEISDVSLKVDNNKQAIEQRVEKTTYQRDLNLIKGDINKANEGLNKWRYEIYPKSLFADKPDDQSKYDIGVFIRNKNLTPSQNVLLDDTSLSTGMDYGDSHIAYGLTFIKMSAAKSITTTFYNDDGASFYVNGKQIISTTVNYTSGTSITFTLVQGWNCLEVVLNQGNGSEGFSFSTTLSALSECQLMNCYYGTPVARQSHITNQLVQNTTDINGISGSVQQVMSTVGGSGKVDEFVNNYSTWKNKVDDIETRVGKTYVTKNDFNGLEIGGRNLILNSAFKKGRKEWSDWGNPTTREIVSSNGKSWAHIVGNQQNYQGFNQWTPAGSIKEGDHITFSARIKGNAANQRFTVGIHWLNSGNTIISQDWHTFIVDTTENVYTWTVNASGSGCNKLNLMVGVSDPSIVYNVYFTEIMVVKGNKATDWAPAPEDDEINGQNLVSNLHSNWEQGSFDGSRVDVGGTYSTGKVDNSTIIRVKELVPVSGSITISNAYSNQSKKPIQHYIVAFDVDKKYLGSSYVSAAWNDFPRIVDMKDAKYIAVIVRYKDESAITPSDISQICIKIERGTSATPFTLAPEDVNGKIVNVETIANQTAKKFEWIVKGGDSSSNFTLTDRVADLVADRINFNGLVKFSGLNTDAKNEIGKVAQSKVDGLDVGGRNLALQSKDFTSGEQYWSINSNFTRSVDSDGFTVLSIKRSGAGLEWNRAIPHNYIPVDEMHRGIIVSFDFMCDKVSELDRGCICALQTYNSGGGRIGWYESQDILSGAQCKLSAPLSDGKWIRVQIPFSEGDLKATYGNSDAVAYTSVSFNLVANGSIHFKKIKIEYGNKATDWTPAPEDYLPQASLVSNWTTNTTWIDGGKIYTNSITADKIATDAIKSRNYISSGGTQGSFLNLSDGSFTSPNLSWDSNGNLIAKNANLSGEITATKGTIGKYEITDQWLTTGSGSTCTGIGGNQAFWAGAEDSNSAPFRVGYDGSFVAENATIYGNIKTGNIGDAGDTAWLVDGHLSVQGTANDTNIYSTWFKFGIGGDYYLKSVSDGVECYRNLYATDFIAGGWIYNASGGHYTWQDRNDAYISCGDYNGHNVYYYANYHAFYVNKDSGQGMMYINTNGVTSRVGFTKTSDERIKKNFESFDDNIIDAYMNIEPVKYQLKQSSNDKYHFGFKAQHIDKVFSDYGDIYNESFDICTSRPIDPDKAKELYGVDGMVEEYGLRYDELIAPTTYMVQHTYKELESTKNELEQVKQEKADLETRLQAIEAKLGL